MKKTPQKPSSKPEKVTGEQALERMKRFGERKEKMIASILASKN